MEQLLYYTPTTAQKKLLPWIDGLLDASEENFAATGKPLYSSHMIDLSEEPIEENIEICKGYLERMSKMGMTLEIELQEKKTVLTTQTSTVQNYILNLMKLHLLTKNSQK
jgi:fructose/tagatose bisphosphate aldolase